MIEDVRQDTELRRSEASSSTSAEANGGNESSKANGDANKKGVNGAEKTPDLAVPQRVVEEALKATRECLEDIAYVEE